MSIPTPLTRYRITEQPLRPISSPYPWVGALIIFLALSGRGREIQLLSRRSDKRIIRSFSYLVIGLMQAVLLALVLQFGLGLQINHPLAFYLACCHLGIHGLYRHCPVPDRLFKGRGKISGHCAADSSADLLWRDLPNGDGTEVFNILYPFAHDYSVRLLRTPSAEPALWGLIRTVWLWAF